MAWHKYPTSDPHGAVKKFTVTIISEGNVAERVEHYVNDLLKPGDDFKITWISHPEHTAIIEAWVKP